MEFNSTIVIVILAIYLAFMLFLGFYFKKRVNTFGDFILGNRGIPWFVIAMTMLATLANAQQTLGIAGTSYALGLSPMIWFFVLVNIFIYPLLVRLGSRYRHLKFETIVDLAEARFPGSGRNTILLAIWQIAWGVCSTAICFFGGALVIETVFGIPMWLAIVIVGVITVFYCMMGGLNGVVFTDTIQWLIIIFGTAFLVPAVFTKFGSFSAFFSDLLGNTGYVPIEGAEVWPGYTDLFSLPVFAGVTPIAIIAMGLAGSLWIPIDLGFMQRMLAAKDPKDSRRASLGFLLIVTLWASIMVVMGVMGGQIFPGVQVTDSVILLMANEAMPGIGTAIFVTAITAAVMSTVSTYLNATAAIITKNFYKRFINKDADDKQMIKFIRIMIPVVAVAALCFAPAVRNSGVFATAVTAQIVLCAAVSPMILLSTYWKRMTEAAAFWGCLISGVVTLALVFYSGGGSAVFNGAGIAGIPAIFIGLVIGFVIYIVMSLLKKYDPDSIGPQFKAIFDSQEKPARVPNTDLIIIGAGIVLVLIAIIVRSNAATPHTWPPIAGVGGKITDIVLYIIAAGLTVISVYILVRTIKWVRSLNK